MIPALNPQPDASEESSPDSPEGLQSDHVHHPMQEIADFFDFNSLASGQVSPGEHLAASESALFNPPHDIWWALSTSKSASPGQSIRLPEPHHPIIADMNFLSCPYTPGF
ncbi:hypothetical protein D9757_007268 [Collybiopsis confluens]|uniref:Uncharacterized protein n=1 Tax=Collybiopsis confluens TaxID=2823264 RepID=A0A8H5HGF7_9AGAR|nr:hypothetical protein D9757_007268 [Collybiopsis confluens]